MGKYSLLYTEKPAKLIELAIASSFLKGDKSVNVALIGDSGDGKTLMLRHYGKIDKVICVTDTTYYGITNKYLPLIERNEVNTLLFTDFIKIVERKTSTRQNMLTILNALIEEGITEIEMPNLSIKTKNPIRCGIVIAITPECFMHLTKIGYLTFLQRMLPVSYSYTEKQVSGIMDYIKRQFHLKEDFYKKTFKDKKITLDYKYTHGFKDTIQSLTDEYGRFNMKIKPFRLQIMYQSLLKASALLRCDNKVTKKDEEILKDLLKYVTFKMPNLPEVK